MSPYSAHGFGETARWCVSSRCFLSSRKDERERGGGKGQDWGGIRVRVATSSPARWASPAPLQPRSGGPAPPGLLLPNLIINTATPSTILCKTSFTKFGVEEKKWGAAPPQAPARGLGDDGPIKHGGEGDTATPGAERAQRAKRPARSLNYHDRLFKKCATLHLRGFQHVQ